MTQKTLKTKKLVKETGDEHELLQQENFTWLAEFRELLSPYWSARLEYDTEDKAHILALKGTRVLSR